MCNDTKYRKILWQVYGKYILYNTGLLAPEGNAFSIGICNTYVKIVPENQ